MTGGAGRLPGVWAEAAVGGAAMAEVQKAEAGTGLCFVLLCFHRGGGDRSSWATLGLSRLLDIRV